MATFDEMNPGSKLTDGHAERKALGLEDTVVTPHIHVTLPCSPPKPPSLLPDFTITEDASGKFFTLTKGGKFVANFINREAAEKAAL